MTDKKEEDKTKKLREELEALKDERLLLEEKLELQSTSWLYSHHLLLSISFGVAYGAIIGNLIYLLAYSLSPLTVSDAFTQSLLFVLVLFIILGIPPIAIVPPIVLLKAPRFALKSLLAYFLSFFLFESLILYADPVHIFASQYQGFERLTRGVFPLIFFQYWLMAFALILAPQLVRRCGHRLVLDGSAFSFEVDADITTVSEQLNKLEEDFRFVLDRSSSKPDRLYFKRTSKKETIVLQFFLQSKGNKTDVGLVMHSIVNDIPMRAGREKVNRIGKTLMKWIEVHQDSTVLATTNDPLITKIIQDSKESFYRQPFGLPSKKVVKQFLKDHWKDFAVITSVLVAIFAWLFPLK